MEKILFPGLGEKNRFLFKDILNLKILAKKP